MSLELLVSPARGQTKSRPGSTSWPRVRGLAASLAFCLACDNPFIEKIRERAAAEYAAAVQPGEAAPGWQGLLATGDTLRSRDVAGRPILLFFYNRGCIPCLREIPQIAELRRQYPALVIVGVDSEPYANPARAAAFAIEKRIKWPVIVDADDHIAAAFRFIEGVPKTVLISRDQLVLRFWIGGVDLLAPHVQAAIQAAVSFELGA